MEDAFIIQAVVSLAAAAVLAFIPANIARSKGRSFGLWWFYGWMLFIVALVHSLVLPSDERAREASMLAAGGRKCPYCAEIVKREAVVCRFCSRDLPPLESVPHVDRNRGGNVSRDDAISPVSDDELERYMERVGYADRPDADETDYRTLALAELQVMSADQRRRAVGTSQPQPVSPPKDAAADPVDDLAPYEAWVTTRTPARWAAFMAFLQASSLSLPHGTGASDVMASIYPEAVGQPEFDGYCGILESV